MLSIIAFPQRGYPENDILRFGAAPGCRPTLDLIAEGTTEMGFEVPPYLKEAVDQGFYGPKTGQGFYD